MRRMCCLAASVIVALWATDPTLIAQKQRPIFISLTGPNGTPVTDLQAGEVSVTEDGVEAQGGEARAGQLADQAPRAGGQRPGQHQPDQRPARRPQGIVRADSRRRGDVDVCDGGHTSPAGRPTTDKQKLLDGIGLIAPDSGAGMFFDALSEAAGRIAKDKTPHFPVILMVGSDFGVMRASDPDFKKLQETILTRAVTVHIIVMGGSGGTSGGGAQTEIGLAVTKLSGGRYENINSTTRLATLLPEMGQENRGEPGAPEPSVPRHLRTSGRTPRSRPASAPPCAMRARRSCRSTDTCRKTATAV